MNISWARQVVFTAWSLRTAGGDVEVGGTGEVGISGGEGGQQLEDVSVNIRKVVVNIRKVRVNIINK